MAILPQLYLLPFAGGNHQSFQFLEPHLKNNFEYIPLELPGRGQRKKEALLVTRSAAVRDYLNQIEQKRNDQPYLLYGHSMGAALALEVAVAMQKKNDRPASLIVSGKSWPITGINHQMHRKPLPELMNALQALGGFPESMLTNERVFKMFSGPLLADFQTMEKSGIEQLEQLRLKSPIVALMGHQEKCVEQIDHWQKYSEKAGKTFILPGNHFFIYEQAERLAEVILDVGKV